MSAETPGDSLIDEIIRGLDMAIVEWNLDQTYRPLLGTPRWFTGSVPWSSLPFLEHFVAEARRYLHHNLHGVIASDQFTVEHNGEELLLRARALKADGRLIVVIERLEGAADMRPILREARQQALDHEMLAERARTIHEPLLRLTHAVDELRRTELANSQSALVDAITHSLATLQEAAAALPAARQPRRTSK